MKVVSVISDINLHLVSDIQMEYLDLSFTLTSSAFNSSFIRLVSSLMYVEPASMILVLCFITWYECRHLFNSVCTLKQITHHKKFWAVPSQDGGAEIEVLPQSFPISPLGLCHMSTFAPREVVHERTSPGGTKYFLNFFMVTCKMCNHQSPLATHLEHQVPCYSGTHSGRLCYNIYVGL